MFVARSKTQQNLQDLTCGRFFTSSVGASVFVYTSGFNHKGGTWNEEVCQLFKPLPPLFWNGHRSEFDFLHKCFDPQPVQETLFSLYRQLSEFIPLEMLLSSQQRRCSLNCVINLIHFPHGKANPDLCIKLFIVPSFVFHSPM